MPDEFDASFSDSITFAQRDALLDQLRQAWRNLSPVTQAALKPALDDAHEQFQAFLAKGVPPSPSTQQTLRMKSYLTGDWDGHLMRLGQPINQAAAQPLASPIPPEALQATVGPDGEILGMGKYQQLDPRWELIAGTVWLKNLGHKHPFPAGMPPILPMNEQVSFTMVGDFGTGNFGSGDSPSVKIAKFVPSLKPDYTIHLGDVYYAGTNDEESKNLLGLWPQGSKGSFALNSNHEMYSGGDPYFNSVVGGRVFNRLQSPFSFFALENSNWIIVGLDSAYYSSAEGMYLSGTLGKNNAQIPFLQRIAQKGKKVIVLTHHNPIPVSGYGSGANPLQLFTDVSTVFAGYPPPTYWYYGHEHIGAAYAQLEEYGTLCRCLGHGGLPWGFSSSLKAAQQNGAVAWFEQRNAGDTDDKLRVFNGFVHVELDGPSLREMFYDETGSVAWIAGRQNSHRQ